MTPSFALSRWFRPSFARCLICDRDAGSPQRHHTAPPVRHPEAQAILRSLCRSCSEAIPWIAAPVCRICGRPEVCPDCPRRVRRHVVFCRSAVRYDSNMRELLARYKYRGSEKLAPLMAAMLAFAYERVVRETAGHGFHAITSVPLARERLEERGFNQAEQMARRIAEWYGISYVPLLQRNRHTEKQSLKNRRRRLQDMKGNFMLARPEQLQALKSQHPGPLRLLLVDDIYTTGSTMNECAAAVCRDGAIFNNSSILAPTTIHGLLWARS